MGKIESKSTTIKIWSYVILSGLFVFLASYYRIEIATRIFLPVAVILLVSSFADFSRSLVFAAIASSILALNLVRIHMFEQYWFQLGLVDFIILLQLLILIIFRTLNTNSALAKDLFAGPMILFGAGAVISIMVAYDKSAAAAYTFLFLIGYIFYRYITSTFQAEDGLRLLAVLLIVSLAFIVVWSFINKSTAPANVRAGIFMEAREGYVFAGPNGLAAILIMLLPFTFLVFSLEDIRLKLILLVLLLLGLFLLSKTYSRNGYLSFIASSLTVILLSLRRIRTRHTTILAIFGSILLIFIATQAFRRLFSIGAFQVDASALFRLIMWRSAINEFVRHPFTGIGLGNFYYITKLSSSGFAHNLYLNVAAETGIVGGIALFWLLGSIFYKLVRLLPSAKSGFMQNLNICLIGSWVAFCINNTFDQVCFFFDRNSEMKFFWLILAVTTVYISQSRLSHLKTLDTHH